MESRAAGRDARRKGLRPGIAGAAWLCLLSLACAASGGNGGDAEGNGQAAQSVERAERRDGGPPLDRAWVIFGADTVVAEVARTAEQRQQGLMNRESVPDGTGMLFVFEDSDIRSFWMANTYIPLDVAYMDPSYRIVDIVAMEPLVTDPYPSSAPAMFALEVRQGWFAERGIDEGDVATVEYGARVGG